MYYLLLCVSCSVHFLHMTCIYHSLCMYFLLLFMSCIANLLYVTCLSVRYMSQIYSNFYVCCFLSIVICAKKCPFVVWFLQCAIVVYVLYCSTVKCMLYCPSIICVEYCPIVVCVLYCLYRCPVLSIYVPYCLYMSRIVYICPVLSIYVSRIVYICVLYCLYMCPALSFYHICLVQCFVSHVLSIYWTWSGSELELMNVYQCGVQDFQAKGSSPWCTLSFY